jgi:hypothetical protein
MRVIRPRALSWGRLRERDCSRLHVLDAPDVAIAWDHAIEKKPSSRTLHAFLLVRFVLGSCPGLAPVVLSVGGRVESQERSRQLPGPPEGHAGATCR